MNPGTGCRTYPPRRASTSVAPRDAWVTRTTTSLPRGGRSGSRASTIAVGSPKRDTRATSREGPSPVRALIAGSAGAALEQRRSLGVRLEPVGHVPAHRHDAPGSTLLDLTHGVLHQLG